MDIKNSKWQKREKADYVEMMRNDGNLDSHFDQVEQMMYTIKTPSFNLFYLN